ncbi:MAG: PEP-CTERM sorting domain-containing protein [Phycisphaerae bacterium]|nr:PEP-CTERM sorting domain-containing protein [Phycisphaerae bacterium]
MKGRSACVVLVVIAVSSFSTQAAVITGISIPVNSMDQGCYARNDGLWSVAVPPYPLNTNTGIGRIINPASTSVFSLHDHVYSTSYVPDPTRAVVTYKFNQSAVVDQVEIIQHRNGITRIQGFVGDSLGSLVSIGAIFGPNGDVTGVNTFSEGQSYLFDFNNTMGGRYFQMIVLKTSLSNGYATYQVVPRDANSVAFEPALTPEPASLVVMLGGIGLLLKRRRRGR